MRQTEAKKIDPLTRIQEEIKEVVRREQEYHRQLTCTADTMDANGNFDQSDRLDNASADNNVSVDLNSIQLITISDDNQPSNTTSLNLSLTSKESYDGHHSDDSGISASCGPISDNTLNNSRNVEYLNTGANKEQRYIGPNCYTMTPEPPQQKLIAHAVTTTKHQIKSRQFALSSTQKGMMQRFIASRGKIQTAGNQINTNNAIALNGKSAAALLGLQSPAQDITSSPTTMPLTPMSVTPIVTLSPTVIERDSEGRPIRPGFIPVEVKIQRELKDLRSRESELKKIRKIRASTSNLLETVENENVQSDEDDANIEHCYGPKQLLSSKFNNELNDVTHASRITPSPDFDSEGNYERNNYGMRPAVSLAQLCDLTPEEAPSSHRLIEQWESLIQQNA